MTITEKQIADRRKGIGSSDAPAIMGYDPWRNQHDVWREKMGYDTGFEGNEATDFGNRIERVLLDYAADHIGERVVAPSGPFVKGNLRANVDGMVGAYKRGKPIVEAKAALFQDGWGEPGTDEIPSRTLIQVHHQMMAADSDLAYVVRMKHYGIDLYPVAINGDLGRTVLETCEAWWQRHIVEGEEPDPTPVGRDTVKGMLTMHPCDDDAEPAHIDPELVREAARAKELRDEYAKHYENCRAKIVQQMGEAKRAETDGWRVTRSLCQGRTSLDQKALKADHPEIVAQYQTTGPMYGILRMTPKKAKEQTDE